MAALAKMGAAPVGFLGFCHSKLKVNEQKGRSIIWNENPQFSTNVWDQKT